MEFRSDDFGQTPPIKPRTRSILGDEKLRRENYYRRNAIFTLSSNSIHPIRYRLSFFRPDAIEIGFGRVGNCKNNAWPDHVYLPGHYFVVFAQRDCSIAKLKIPARDKFRPLFDRAKYRGGGKTPTNPLSVDAHRDGHCRNGISSIARATRK